MERPILIQIAMEIESSFIDLLEEREEIEINKYKFYKGKINNKNIVVSISKVGVINSASSLTIALLKFNPKYIINAGIAGASDKNLHIKDLVVATNCVNINSYKTKYYKEGEGIHPETWELLTFISGETDRFIDYKSDDFLLEQSKNLNYNIRYGTIGSGDVWNSEADRKLLLNEKFHILCEDMEAISTYTIANTNNIPVISLKMISDNFLTGEEYDRNVGKYLQEVIYNYINILTKN